MDEVLRNLDEAIANLRIATKELAERCDELFDPTWPEHCYTAEEWAEIQARKG